MAELKIQADSGGGTVSFKGPATTTSNAAVQLTLPVDDGSADQYLKTNGSGVLSWAAAGGGKILQVVGASKTDTASASVATTAFWDTGFTVTITPSAATSKVLLLGMITASTDDDQALDTQLRRKIGSASVAALTGANADAASNRPQFHAMGIHHKSTWVANIHINYLDSPNTTDAVIYSFQLHHGSGSTRTMYLNRHHSDQDNAERGRYTSHLTAIEVGA